MFSFLTICKILLIILVPILSKTCEEKDKKCEINLRSKYTISMKDFSTIKENIFLYFSKQLKIWRKNKAKGIYRDPDFHDTILKIYKSSIKNREIIWKRPILIMENKISRIFGKISPFDVYQGFLGNSSFLAALSALATKPALIKRLFQTNEINEYGFYGIWLCISGKWQIITLNDYFPVFKDNRSLLFSKAINNKIWVGLLEKAYLKSCLQRSTNNANDCDEPFRTLTGAPSLILSLKELNNLQDLWDYMIQSYQKGYLITGFPSKEEIFDLKGIMNKHTYTLMELKEYDKIKLIRLRNPLGSNYFNGEWSSNSSKWSSLVKKQIEFKREEKGTFYMSFEEFVKYFDWINLCLINENFYHSYRTYTLKKNITTLILEFKLEKNSEFFFTVSQSFKDNNEYRPYSILLVDGKTNKIYFSDFRKQRNFDFHFKRKKGNYKIFIDFTNYMSKKKYLSFRDDEEITLSFYGEKKILFNGYISSKNRFEELARIIKSVTKKTDDLMQILNYEVDSNFKGYIRRYKHSFNQYTYFYYKNTSPNSNLKEELNIIETEDYYQIYPEIKRKNKKTKFLIDLNPNQDYLIIFKSYYDKISKSNLEFESISGTSTNYTQEYLEKLLREKGKLKQFYENKIISYSIRIMDWHCFLYDNVNFPQINITIKLLQLNNMKCVTHILNSENEIHISLKYGQHKLVALRKINQLLGFNYKQEVKYEI